MKSLKMPMQGLLSILVALLLMACAEEAVVENESAQVLKPVRTLTVTEGSKQRKSFTGVVDAVKTAALGFRVAGELIEVHSKEGDEVVKGQVLAVIDPTDYKIQRDAAQAQYDKATSEFNRAKSLITQGAISNADYDNLKAQMQNAQAQLDSAKQNLKYTQLKAPFDGIIASQKVSNFEKVSSSVVFAVIHDLSAYEVKIDIPESVMIKIKREENPEDTPDVYAIFDGNENRRYPLRFKEVSTRADERTQSYGVTFVMPEPDDINLLPGMSTRVFAELEMDGDTSKGMYVPAHAVLEDSSGRFVYVVELGQNQQGQVQRRSVVVGDLNENGLQILQGLDVGERVVTAGMSKMSQGLAVRLMDEG